MKFEKVIGYFILLSSLIALVSCASAPVMKAKFPNNPSLTVKELISRTELLASNLETMMYKGDKTKTSDKNYKKRYMSELNLGDKGNITIYSEFEVKNPYNEFLFTQYKYKRVLPNGEIYKLSVTMRVEDKRYNDYSRYLVPSYLIGFGYTENEGITLIEDLCMIEVDKKAKHVGKDVYNYPAMLEKVEKEISDLNQ